MKVTVVFINNWSLVKITMTWNQNYLEANKQRAYIKLIYMEKDNNCPFSSEHQQNSLG
jgi:hypothetical protein